MTMAVVDLSMKTHESSEWSFLLDGSLVMDELGPAVCILCSCIVTSCAAYQWSCLRVVYSNLVLLNYGYFIRVCTSSLPLLHSNPALLSTSLVLVCKGTILPLAICSQGYSAPLCSISSIFRSQTFSKTPTHMHITHHPGICRWLQ